MDAGVKTVEIEIPDDGHDWHVSGESYDVEQVKN